MNDNIRLLEDRVADAAERLQRLAEERSALRREVEDLRRRATGREVVSVRSSSAVASEEAIVAERAGLAARLREALELLRDE